MKGAVDALGLSPGGKSDSTLSPPCIVSLRRPALMTKTKWGAV
jgi:hypothetical protein